MKILPVDFQKPWWDIILRQKKLALFAVISQFIGSIFDSIFPILVGYAVTTLDINLFIIVMIIRLTIIWVYNVMLRYNAIFQNQTMSSIDFNANQYFLTVDPIFHTMKSSGKIISKISRGSKSYEDVLDIVSFELLGIVTSLITVAITMFTFGWQIGLASLGFLSFIAIFNISAQVYRTKTFQPRRIKAHDQLKAIQVETLMQAPFIRAIFASTEQINKNKYATVGAMFKDTLGWQAGTYVNIITRTIYVISVFIIGYLVLMQAKNGTLSTVLALSIILAYSSGTSGILSIGNMVKRLTSSLSDINDLFEFIRGFGKQTFPVLEDNIENVTQTTLSLRA
jgi:ABC-type multidrug transport system fused ATPase/permease subunit